MKNITLEMLDSWGRCASAPDARYSRENVLALTGGRKSLTPLECTYLRIPYEDRVWLLTRPGALPEKNQHAFANSCADRAVRRYALHCGIPAVEAWARAWLSGTDRSEDGAAAAVGAAWRAVGAVAEAEWGAEIDAWTGAAAAAEAAWQAMAGSAWDAAGASWQAVIEIDGVGAALVKECAWQVATLRKLIRLGG